MTPPLDLAVEAARAEGQRVGAHLPAITDPVVLARVSRVLRAGRTRTSDAPQSAARHTDDASPAAKRGKSRDGS